MKVDTVEMIPANYTVEEFKRWVKETAEKHPEWSNPSVDGSCKYGHAKDEPHCMIGQFLHEHNLEEYIREGSRARGPLKRAGFSKEVCEYATALQSFLDAGTKYWKSVLTEEGQKEIDDKFEYYINF